MVDLCPNCKGMFLEAGELEEIQESQENDYSEELKKMPDLIAGAYHMAKEKKRKAVTCPSCSGETERKEYGYCSQIMIDKCLSCHGVWLDQGEIEALEIFFERSQMDTEDIRNVFWKSFNSSLEN